MSTDDPLLDRRAIEEAFRRLGDRLAHRGVVADLYVFGGAAMAVKHLHLSNADDVLALCAEIFPEEPVPDRARLVLEDLFEGS